MTRHRESTTLYAGRDEFVSTATLARANAEAIRTCREAAAKAGKEQKCLISVPSAAR